MIGGIGVHHSRRVIGIGRWVMVLLCVTTLSACATWRIPMDADTVVAATAIAHQLTARHQAIGTAAALADMHVTGGERFALLPRLTVVARFRPPAHYELSGHTPTGLEVFRFVMDDGRYRLDAAGATRTGHFNQHPSDRRSQRRGRNTDPLARALGGLTHILDGAIGMPLDATALRPADAGHWRVRIPGGTLRFAATKDEIQTLTVHQRNREPIQVTFSDYRISDDPISDDRISDDRLTGVPGTPSARTAPHHIVAHFPGPSVTLNIRVEEWIIDPVRAHEPAPPPPSPSPSP